MKSSLYEVIVFACLDLCYLVEAIGRELRQKCTIFFFLREEIYTSPENTYVLDLVLEKQKRRGPPMNKLHGLGISRDHW